MDHEALNQTAFLKRDFVTSQSEDAQHLRDFNLSSTDDNKEAPQKLSCCKTNMNKKKPAPCKSLLAAAVAGAPNSNALSPAFASSFYEPSLSSLPIEQEDDIFMEGQKEIWEIGRNAVEENDSVESDLSFGSRFIKDANDKSP